MSGIRFGVVLPQGWRSDLTHLADPVAQFEAMVGVAREADDLGYDSVWLYDHVQAVSGEPETTFECWTSLSAIARETRRVRLGQIVTCNSFRNPALLAKMAATLDVASGGRAFLGLGGGWDQREYDAYGFDQPYPSTGERLTRLDEAARVITAMREPVATVDGRFHRVTGAQNVPPGVQRPHIPLMIGGSGEKRTLRTVARYADACNLTDHTDPAFHRHKLDVLAGHCAEVGRDYDAILRTAALSVFTGATDAEVTARLGGRDRAETATGSAVGTPAELVDILGRLVDAGIEYFMLYFHEPTDPEPMRLFAREVVPQLG
ncbi:TIGR03560 family F420-dependent LLM class oxidoreductase [Micromonospora siamensis]|uniref:Probable F420-dependent oxidoreductase, Rv1855c family n=1 Tax=Micromonospora siamensis TaxID=299152 RepID=A0A1C5JRC4_9ACTN|nr:TIGR03560 family F420-dependent LLM class oxidoreductase [Micromonospora siamensis]SCG73033.1 probable F420-dependent oxidoreductase, Rv1855c family [Micromonospora siamensis]